LRIIRKDISSHHAEMLNPILFMKTADNLKYQFKRIDGKGYKAYKDIKGQYSLPQYRLIIDHVQGDPFAAPSRIRVRIDRNSSGFEEDTSATNFMIRDHRMQQLVTKDKEPMTPFIDKIRQLYHDKDISTILVMGGSGDYFSVSDHVIQMTNYIASDVTQRAHHIANQFDPHRINEGGNQFGDIKQRIPMPQGFNPYRGKNRLKITVPRTREIVFGCTIIDLWDIDQLVDISQTRAIGYAAYYATRYMDGKHTLRKIVERVIQDIDNESLDILVPYLTGDLARFRSIELAAAINRMRTLKVK